MNTINVQMLEITDKTLICTSGNFFMGVKNDNMTTQIVFDVPDKFKQNNAICIAITPDKSTQYSIPLTDMGFYVTSSISKLVGDWTLILMLLGNDDDTNMPVCVSDSVIGTIKDSLANPDDLESLPTDGNLEVLYNNMLTLYNEVEKTLLSCDPSDVKQIEEMLEEIKSNMSKIVAIDWESIEKLGDIEPEIAAIQTTCDTISAKIDNIKVDVDFTEVLNAIAEVKENTNTIINSFDNVDIRLENIETTTNEISASVGNIDTNVNTANTNINNMSTNVDTINTNTTTMISTINTINTNINTINTNIDTINANEKLDREDLTTLKTNDATIISLLTTANEVAESL